MHFFTTLNMSNSDNEYDNDAQSHNTYDYEYEYDSEYDTETAVSKSTRNSKTKKKKNFNVNNTLSLPNVYTITKIINGKKTKIKLCETKQKVNARIINAVTGIPYYNEDERDRKYVVGSRQEDDLFKVKMLTGLGGSHTGLFFYESPDQYERHQCVTLNDEIKIKWLEKNQQYRLQLLKDKHLYRKN